MSALRRPGFGDGFASLFFATRLLWREPGAWPVALVPSVIFVTIGLTCSSAAAVWLTPELWAWLELSNPATWYGEAGKWLVAALSLMFSAIVGVFAAFTLTPPLSAPALDRLVSLQEHELGVPARDSLGFWAEIGCGLRAQLFAFGFATPVLCALWVLKVLVPPAAVLTVPLELLVISLCLAWNLFDYPLTLRGVGAGDRLGFILGNFKPVLGFGLCFGALFWLPCFGILMLPVGAVAATRLLYQMLEADPLQLPSVPRPAALPPSAPPQGPPGPRPSARI